MRLKKVKNAKEKLEQSTYIINEPEGYINSWNKEVFKNNNNIHIEIGMGKGQFIINMAKKYPDINFIGIEKYDSVLLRAAQKLDGLEKKISNIKIIMMDAIDISKVFNHEISRIYLNFSDPWPKSKHAKKRLTSIDFLKEYDKIFLNEAQIFQKTDNDLLFEFSIKSLNDYGYKLQNVTRDLSNEFMPDNIMTEYEEKFSKLGSNINYLEAYK